MPQAIAYLVYAVQAIQVVRITLLTVCAKLTLIFFLTFYLFGGQSVVFTELNVELDLLLEMQHLTCRLPSIS